MVKLTFFLRSFLILWMLSSLPSFLPAQEIPTKVNIQNRTGDLPFSSQIGSAIEHVDLSSGALNVRIPISSIKGRGRDFSYYFRYNGRFLVVSRRVDIFGNPVQEWTIESRNYLA